MLDLIRNKFTGKSLVLLGFGREGQSSYTVLRRIFPDKPLAIADKDPAIRENPIIREDRNLTFITGDDYLERISEYDFIMRSPGIPIWQFVENSAIQCFTENSSPSTSGIPRQRITSQTDLFLQAYSTQIIGVTGTKGKSTTSSLIHHIFQTAGEDSVLLGNIGNPAFHFIDRIASWTKIVFELSSHQLEYITIGPHVAIVLNLYQEHLDAYSGFEAYQLAKINITKFQTAEDLLIFNADDVLVSEKIAPYSAVRKSYPFSLQQEYAPGGFIKGGMLCFSDGKRIIPVWKIHQERFLRGDHNLKNILAAINVAILSGVSHENIEDGISTFKGLAHRLEYVGENRSIHFYNDSIATIPEACMEAIKAIPMVDTLIAGGFDRGIDYSGLAGFLCHSSIRNLILVGAAGKRIGENIEQLDFCHKKLFYINRFDNFREIAFRETRPGYCCLLSPAAASYDEFKNFEERGKRFRELVIRHE